AAGMFPLPKLLFWSLAFGSIKPTLTSSSGCGNETPRSTIALTTANCVLAPPMPGARTRMARRQNDFSLKKIRRPSRRSWAKVSRIIWRILLAGLFGSQRNHWVHASSAPRRHETRNGGNQRYETGHDHINRRIERLHLEEDILERVG